jgi:hypothetical protein
MRIIYLELKTGNSDICRHVNRENRKPEPQ